LTCCEKCAIEAPAHQSALSTRWIGRLCRLAKLGLVGFASTADMTVILGGLDQCLDLIGDQIFRGLSAAFLRRSRTRQAESTLAGVSAEIIRKVVHRDIVACGQPHAFVPRYVCECTLQILLAIRLIAHKGMQAKRHDPAGVRAVLV
jgi:hypothetical protein